MVEELSQLPGVNFRVAAFSWCYLLLMYSCAERGQGTNQAENSSRAVTLSTNQISQTVQKHRTERETAVALALNRGAAVLDGIKSRTLSGLASTERIGRRTDGQQARFK